MMHVVRYQCSACSVVCQRGVAQALQDIAVFLRAIGLAMLREPEEAAPRPHRLYTCFRSFRKTALVRSLDADETFLYVSPSAGGPERLLPLQTRFGYPFDGETMLSHAEQTKVKSHRNAWRLRNAR